MKNESHAGKPLYEKKESKQASTIIDCVYCGFAHVYPLPSIDENKKLYTEEYYEKAKPDYIKGIEKDSEWLACSARNRIEQIEMLLDRTTNIKLLDIGSGAGEFLKEACEKSWKGTGIEPSYLAYQYSSKQGLHIINDFFNEEIAGKLPDYDVIHMNNVLEHIPFPEEVINLIWNKLEPEGILCVAVPNDFNEFQKLLFENYNYKPWWINPQEHINYFNFNSLRGLLERNNFEILKETTDFPMELFLLMGDNYTTDSELGAQCHSKRKEFEMKLFNSNLNELKDKLYEGLASNHLGREVIMFARKKKKI